MKIGILTGGGDVPGLNPCIKALVDRAIDAGHETLGIRRGWAGLLNYHPDEPMDSPTNASNIMPLNKMAVRTVARTGGTFLHTSRTRPSHVPKQSLPEHLNLPDTLWNAAQRLKTCRRARELFGNAFIEHFAATREWEERELRKAITDWELRRYFEII